MSLTSVPVTGELDHVLRAALEVLDRDGIDGLTMRAVAKTAGVTATAIYRHHASKDDLLRAVRQSVYRFWCSQCWLAMEGRDEAERLRLSYESYRRFALEHPSFYELLFLRPAQGHVRQYPHGFRDRPAAAFQFLTDRVAECMRAGLLRDDDPVEVALTLWAHLHGLVLLQRSGRFGDDPETFRAFYTKSVARLLAGLR